MKTSVIEVRDMLAVLSVPAVEERIGNVPGVESVTVNFAARSATVRYDETRVDIADIRSGVRQSGFESAAPAVAPAGDGHESHAPAGAAPATPAPAEPKPSPVAPGAAPASMSGAPESTPDAASAAPATAGQPDDEQKGKGPPAER